MTDKKIEDPEARLPQSGFRNGFVDEKEGFLSTRHSRQPPSLAMSKISNSPGLSILAYCLSSISMTVVNKYVVSGDAWNLNLFYLAIQVGIEFYKTMKRFYNGHGSNANCV